MGRLGSIVSALVVTGSLAAFIGCGSSVRPTPGFGVPAVIRLAPTPTASIDLGGTLQFSASALSGSKTVLTTTFSYSTSNPNIVSIANNGLACAGTWDSVATPVVCTPGGVGKATITASSSGVVSAPTTVYVHQPIAQINVSAIPILTPPLPFPTAFPFPSGYCYTALAGSTITAPSQSYDAQALADDVSGHPTVDITSSVGPFSWSASQPAVATLTPLNSFGIPNGQVQVTAHTPGMTQISASIADATSAPVSFTTCPVQSISLAVNVTGGTTISASKGTSSSAAATVIDIAGNLIAPTLTWSSSNTAVANVSSSGGITSPGAGGATITASCIAPNCNINLSPPQPIYPEIPISATYTSTTSTPFSVYAASTNQTCATNVNCVSFLVPISGSPPVVGNGAQLPNVPNSMLFAPAGGTVYMGSQKELMAVAVSANPPTIAPSPTVTGNVLAASPDGKKLIVSDTVSPVKQVFIFDTAASTSTSFVISGPTTVSATTAAAFSPDSLKAFIVAATVAPNSGGQNVVTTTLYVYSTQSGFQAVQLASGTPAPPPPLEVSFLANGMFGYLAGGTFGTSYLATCDDPSQPLSTQVGNVAGAISFIRPLPDGSGFVGLALPDFAFIKASINGMPLSTGTSGCPAPLGGLSVANAVSTVPGAGTSTPIAFFLSSDGQKTYTVVQNSGTILVYDLTSGLPSTLSLVGNPNPLSAALAPDGQTLYVGADDGKVHFVNTVSGGDVYQVNVPSSSLCTITTGGQQPTCLPDLLAVKP
jgi:hypothetical protein